MSLQIILGGSGSGKTRLLYERLIQASMAHPEKTYLLLVPEQFTMQTQKEIVSLHPMHGTMNIDILSFQRLAYRVFEELAIVNPEVLDDMGKAMVLRKVTAAHKKKLGIFQGHLSQNGFISQLKSMLSELYQYGISPDQLEQMIGETDRPLLKQKLEDFLVVYRAFRDYISEKYITSEEILDVLCRVLPRSEKIAGSVIALDGYTGLTPVQYRLLELFLIHSRQVILTAAMDPKLNPLEEGSFHQLFYMSRHMVCRAAALAENNQVEQREMIVLSNRPHPRFSGGGGRESALDFLEQNLYRYGKRTFDRKQNEIEICAALNPAGEIGQMVARIQLLVKKEGMRYRDMAVVTGDLPGYANEIVRQFERSGIPYFLDQKKSILENPMVDLIRAALEIVQRDFEYECVFRYLKTGLTDIDEEQLNRLENYVLALGIRGFHKWNSQWEQIYRGGKTLNMDRLNETRLQVLEPLEALREGIRGRELTVEDRTRALVAFLQATRLEERLKAYETVFTEQGLHSLAMEYSQVYGLVMDLFDRLTGLLGQETVSLREYAQILDAGFEEIKVGLIPATVDRVVVGDLTRTRLDHIQALFFVGVNDGVVPARMENSSLLTDPERKFLGDHHMELAPTAQEESCRQRFYLYLMMTKPGRLLVMSYAAMNSAGKSQRPSSLIGEVRKLFPLLQVQTQEETGQVLSVPMGKQALIEGLRRFEDMQEDPELLELYRWFASRPEYREEIRSLVDAAFYSYEERGIGRAAARALYGTALSGSVTRLERYAACAYAHFLQYGLELTRRQEYRLEAVDMGNLFHESIDRCFRIMRETGGDWHALTEEGRKKLVHTCVDQVTKEYGNTIFSSSARNGYLAKKIESITDRTIWALAEQMKKGDFSPAGFEVSFSAIDNLSAMKISLSEDEALHLQGRIDRLDLCEDEEHVYVKVIDYKSGSTSFNLAALYYGLQLQLVVYLDAAMELEQRKHPDKEVVPAGIFYYHIQDPLVEKQPQLTPQDIEEEILSQLRMNGLVNSNLEVIRHMDREIETESQVIPVAMKDGLVQEARSSVAGVKRFEALRSFVRKKLADSGREILEGNTRTKPYKQGTRTACDYCPYHGVCGFDTRTAGYEYRKFRSWKAEEIWGRIEEEGGTGSCQ